MSKELLSQAGRFLLKTSREAVANIVDDEVLYERICCIEKTVMAMKELNISDDLIIKMLQKYWDLRLSEATAFVKDNTRRIQNEREF